MKLKPFLAALLFLLLISLTSILYLSTFTRLHGDDYCIAADAMQLNPESFFVNWYSGWTGRFSYIIFAGFLSMGGPKLAAWLPTISVIFWWVVLTWSLLPLTRFFKIRNKYLVPSTTAALILLVLFSVIPNLFQSVFWKDGLINYCFPLIGFSMALGLLLRVWLGRIQGIKPVLLLFILSFINGGFSEVFSFIQVVSYATLIVTMVIFTKVSKWKYQMKCIIAAFSGAMFGLLVVLIGPGNQIRQGLLPDHPDLFRLITFSIRNGIYIVAKFFIQTPGWALLTILMPFLLGWYLASRRKKKTINNSEVPIWKQGLFQRIGIVSIVTMLIVIAACVPVVYMLDAYPDDRTIILPVFFIVIGTFTSSIMLGYGLSRVNFSKKQFKNVKMKPIIMLLTFLIVSIASANTVFENMGNLPGYQAYAKRWDVRDQKLRLTADSGNSDVKVFGLESRFGIADLRIDPDYWVNQCMANYYDIPLIIGK